MRTPVLTLASALAAGLTHPALADLPLEWDLRVAARSSETTGFNLPAGATLQAADLADDGAIAMIFATADPPARGLWIGNGDGGAVVWSAADLGSASAPAINQSAVVFTVGSRDAASLLRVDRADGSLSVLLNAQAADIVPASLAAANPSLAATGLTGVRVERLDGTIAWLAIENEQSLELAVAGPELVNLDTSVGSAALGGVGGRVELANGGQQIRRYDLPDFFILLAEDVGARTGSPLQSIDSRVDFDATGRAAFVSTRVDGIQSVRLSNGTLDFDVADVNRTNIQSLDAGDTVRPGVAPTTRRVVFSGTDETGVQTAFLADGTDVVVIAHVGDPVAADVEGAFIGSIQPNLNINDLDQTSFIVELVDADGASLGQALLVAEPVADPPGIVGDLDGDGDVDFSDLLGVLSTWGTDDPVADLSGNGTVDFADLLLLLSEWTG
ncbi:MAG: hypothetical protein AB8G96_02540 [Phycisphaerales bacterium]